MEVPREAQVPIDSKARTARERGKITYKFKQPDDPAGLFSFSYYYRSEPGIGNRNSLQPEVIQKKGRYLKGINSYLQLTHSEAFAHWKVVIYTDQATMESIDSLGGRLPALARRILADPNVILAICEWPEYSKNQSNRSIDNTIMRVLRHKAMVDFPEVPVCVRDADTYFIEVESAADFTDQLLAWESSLLEYLRESKKRFLVSGTPSYHRKWHRNTEANFSSAGVLAGMVSSLGGLPEVRDLWDLSLSFIRGRCAIDTESEVITDLYEKTYVGKDEQILIFIWIPALLEKTFFFYFDFANMEDGHFLNEWKQKENPFHSAYKRLMSEFPMWVADNTADAPTLASEKERNRRNREYSARYGLMLQLGEPPKIYEGPTLRHQMAASPYHKLLTLGLTRVATPTPGDPPINRAGLAREQFVDLSAKGEFLAEEESLLTILAEENFQQFLLNLSTVSLAFENPVYQRIMYLMFKIYKRLYTISCREHQLGGRRKTRRTVKHRSTKRKSIR